MTNHGPPPGTLVRRATLAAFALTALYFTGFFPPSDNPNELSRFQAIAAFVDDGTFSIDRLLAKYGNHEDKSVYDSRFYSNKAPGLAFAGTVPYRILRLFAGEPATGHARLFFVLRLLTVSLVSFLALSQFARRLAREPFRDEEAIVTLAVAFGTPFLFFARSFFSHAWTAALLFLSWDLAKSAEGQGSRHAGKFVLAGLLAGWALISEYTAAPILLLLAARVLWGSRLRGAFLFCLGILPPLALLLVYNKACFGSFWSLSSAHEASPLYAASAGHGLFGVGPPRSEAFLGYLFGSSRGLVLFSPFWLWAIPGFVLWWKAGIDRRDCVFAAVASLSYLVILSGYPHWEGGYSLGSRYLLPITFICALGIPFAIRSAWSRWLFLAAVAFSVAHFFLLTASFPYIPPSVSWPAANVAWWSLLRHWVAPNLAHALGVPSVWSLVVPAGATATAVGAATLLRGGLRSRAGALAALLLGVCLLGLTIPLAPELSPQDAGWRAWLFNYLER
jgi:hypothetical protein